MYDDNDVGLSG